MKRFDKGFIYSTCVSAIISSLGVIFFFLQGLMSEAEDEFFDADRIRFWLPIIIAVYVAGYVFQVVYAALYVRTSGYELGENEFKCKRGVLFRKVSTLEYARVHAVNKKQGLFQRIFGIATLTIDSGSTNTALKAEIVIIEKSATVDRIMETVKLRQAGVPAVEAEVAIAADEAIPVAEKPNLYEFTSKLKVIYSVLTTLTTLLTVAIISVFIVAALSALGLIFTFDEELTNLELIVVIMSLALVLALVLSLITFVGTLLSSLFQYHDFRIHRSTTDLEISYGLFTRNTNTFKLKNIKAIKIRQGPILRLFGYVTVRLEVVGYVGGQDNNNKNQGENPGILFPLCKKKNLNETLGVILPEFIPEERQHRSKAFLPFVSWRLLYLAITMMILTAVAVAIAAICSATATAYYAIITVAASVMAVYLIIIIISGLFQYKSQGVTVSENKLTVYNGGIVRFCTVLQKKNIVAIEDKTTPMRQKRGIYTYTVHFYTNASTNTAEIKNLDEAVSGELTGAVRF